jgi:hypothetical protein
VARGESLSFVSHANALFQRVRMDTLHPLHVLSLIVLKVELTSKCMNFYAQRRTKENYYLIIIIIIEVQSLGITKS